MEKFQVKPLVVGDWQGVIRLCNRVFGPNYLDIQSLEQFFGKDHEVNSLCSFVITANGSSDVWGVRITFAPNHWPEDIKNRSLSFANGTQKMAYFKTLAIDPLLQGEGWGPKLTELAIKSLKNLGAESVICHSWKESPNDSSAKYLLKMGFKPIGEIENFWHNNPYACVRCHPQKCTCTAVEMIKNI